MLPRPIELDAVGEVEALVAMADGVDLGPTVAWLRSSGWVPEEEEEAA